MNHTGSARWRRPRQVALGLGLGIVLLVGGGVMLLRSEGGRLRAANVWNRYHAATAYPPLTILYPLDKTLFPPDGVAPTFRWRDPQPRVDTWLISFALPAAPHRLSFLAQRPSWAPDESTWDTIKRQSRERALRVSILGLNHAHPDHILSAAHISIMTSKDPVGAPLFFREVNLPFEQAVKDPSKIRWRFGAISSTAPPPIVLTHLPVCGNCHSFSSDGKVLGMDVDYANSKGSYVITRVAKQMLLATSDIMTWDDYKRADGKLTFGLLSQVSPDGKDVISTVKDRSVFVPKPDLAFSQLFFPIQGILVVYHRRTRTFQALAGADDPAYVQSNPVWSPDKRYIVFARAKAYHLTNVTSRGKILLTAAECREFLVGHKSFKYDLYRVPYNNGRGGKAEPLLGASRDGMSNFFPKYSPNGKWIVFCKAKNYMLLQPDSQLYIIPAAGGKARRLRCNTPCMNSWHTWSPNGHWLVFSSKANGPYTQLWLTHIDASGHSTPPVVLDHLTAPDRAANIPEFVNASPTAIQHIRPDFLDDYSFERSGDAFYRAGDPDGAIRQYRKALALNPHNVNVQQRLGFLLYAVKHQTTEGLAHTREALRLDPDDAFARCDLGMAELQQGSLKEAIAQLSATLRYQIVSHEPRYQPQVIRFNLAQAYLRAGRLPDGATQLEAAVRIAPKYAQAHYLLALVLASQGDIQETVQHYKKAIALKPQLDTSVNLHVLLARNYAKAGQFTQATQAAEQALQLARATGQTTHVSELEKVVQLYRQGRAP